jgi:hypothetical protein
MIHVRIHRVSINLLLLILVLDSLPVLKAAESITDEQAGNLSKRLFRRETKHPEEEDADELMNEFTRDDEQALLELGDASAMMRELDMATTRKHPTPAPTPAPTPRPLPSRIGHCFGGEEFWNGKCYKTCTTFYGRRRRWSGYGNGGYTTRVGDNACAKQADCGENYEKLSYHCYQKCSDLIPGGEYGLRTGESTCSKPDRSDSKTSSKYKSGRISHIEVYGGSSNGWCHGYAVRGYHCGYSGKCSAVPRPELTTCEQLYPGYHR